MGTFNHLRRVACASVLVSSLMMRCAYAAASGSIMGRVLDKETGDPLPGANVMIVGTSIGGSTDLDGKYTLRTVPTGKISMRVTYVGYLPATLGVTVGEDATSTQDFRLTPQAIKGETVVVTAQSKGQMEAINQQLSSN
ncbi:MAG TPA: carboxypeptidase-like regulatory domain-containing protein, partial [Bacteroidota bacterium]